MTIDELKDFARTLGATTQETWVYEGSKEIQVLCVDFGRTISLYVTPETYRVADSRTCTTAFFAIAARNYAAAENFIKAAALMPAKDE